MTHLLRNTIPDADRNFQVAPITIENGFRFFNLNSASQNFREITMQNNQPVIDSQPDETSPITPRF